MKSSSLKTRIAFCYGISVTRTFFFLGKRNSEEAGRWSDFIQNLTKLPEAETVLDEEAGAEKN
ncbi:hypothetical protein YC2023_039796 [Brassica napus]